LINAFMNLPPFNRRKALWVIGGVVVAGLIMGIAALRALSSNVLATSKGTPNAQQFSDWVKLAIPPTAQNWQAYAEGFQDWLVQARFELNPAELEGFLRQNQLVPISETAPPDNPLKQSWFRPGPTLEVYGLKPSDTQQAATASGFYPLVYIERNNRVVVVYITAFDT
jgi:hypothetical protein